MQKNSGNFSMEELMRFANSPAGRQLFVKLQQSGNASVQKAMDQVSKGNMDQAKETLKGLASDPEIQKLFGKTGG